jgi:hypothetical protein
MGQDIESFGVVAVGRRKKINKDFHGMNDGLFPG